MPNSPATVAEFKDGTLATAPLLLLQLMADLAVLEEELRNAEDTMGQPVSAYQDPLAERFCRVGVNNQKIEKFVAWRRSISSLITEGPNDEVHLGKIIAAETVGMAIFAELIPSIRSGEEHGRLGDLKAA